MSSRAFFLAFLLQLPPPSYGLAWSYHTGCFLGRLALIIWCYCHVDEGPFPLYADRMLFSRHRGHTAMDPGPPTSERSVDVGHIERPS